ncbi:hypothetical protein NST45_18370 [Paenibacillus sp. FSL R7-0163]|uniref:hypothetical protein n=1 Tax=Paenibacillus sp. FSL R7-0163 TaxID=2954530 RepID=UPI0030D79902
MGNKNLLEDYGIVAGQCSTDGEHLEPIVYIRSLLMDEDVSEEEARVFLEHFYLQDVRESYLRELY